MSIGKILPYIVALSKKAVQDDKLFIEYDEETLETNKSGEEIYEAFVAGKSVFLGGKLLFLGEYEDKDKTVSCILYSGSYYTVFEIGEDKTISVTGEYTYTTTSD